MPQGTDAAGVLTLRLHSVFAEYFPAGHLPFLADVLTHPDMLALQRLCLGSETVYFDHNQLLSRPPGYAGGRLAQPSARRRLRPAARSCPTSTTASRTCS